MEKKLSARLSVIAELIPAGSLAADVGTDHALLPIHLIRSGRTARVIASDNKAAPLEKARRAVQAAGLSQQIDLRLGDGLSVLAPEEADCIVLAGMGGETIADILAAAPWCADGTHRLLLQPMSKAELLRGALARLGLAAEKECLVRDGGSLYCVLAVRGCGGPYDLAPVEQYLSPALAASGDPLLAEYLEKLLRRLERARVGAARSGRESDRERARELTEVLTALYQRREML